MLLSLMRRMMPVVCVGVALAGCTSEEKTASVTADDPGYKALATGDFSFAQNEFQPKQAKDPHDPYLELDLAVAYQQLGREDLAEALDRQAMVDGKDVHPPYTTFPRDNGKSIAEIACENIAIAHKTEGCEPVTMRQPEPPKNFIVFFDFNRATVTADGEKIVEEAVRTAKAGGVTRIQVTGHTDTVGSDSYNQRLSLRRASAIKEAMSRDGLTGNVTIEGRGFHDPLVPTGPGVREPQNRRAVIELGPSQTVMER